MPNLITKIEALVEDDKVGEVKLISVITGQVQQEDYIRINGLVAYLQNLSRAEKTSGITKPLNFGLKNKYNLEVVTVNIDY